VPGPRRRPRFTRGVRLGRTKLALWGVAALLAAALTLALFAQDEPGSDVAAYIEEVNEVQGAFATRYGSIDRAYREFQLAPEEMETQLPRLRQAAETLTALRTRVAEVEAPPRARRLRLRLLALLAQQERVARELVEVAEYLPRLGDTEQPVAAASARLRATLRAAGGPAEQADALGAYGRRLLRTAKELDGIDPPALLAPAHRRYVAQLEDYGEAATALQRAVREGDQGAVDAAVARLQGAGASRSQDAQRKAIVAYNERVRRIAQLAATLERERQRLERDLA
jgi:hypothetical protein